MKKYLIVALSLASLLMASCTKDTLDGTGNDDNRECKVKLNLKLSDFGELTPITRAQSYNYDPNTVKDMTVFQIINGEIKLNKHFSSNDVTSTPSVSIQPMVEGPKNMLLVLCNFASIKGTNPFTGVNTLSDLNNITADFDASSPSQTGFAPIRGVYRGAINAGSETNINISLERMYSKINFTLTNSFAGFMPTSIQLCNVGNKVSANGIVPTIGDDGKPLAENYADFAKFPTGATYRNMAAENPTGAGTSNHEWVLNENCMGTWNNFALESGKTWINFYKFPGAVSGNNNYDSNLSTKGYYTIADKTPYILVKGIATVTTTGIPAQVEYKIYLGSDELGDMNIIGNYIYNINTTILGVNTTDSRITVKSGSTTDFSPLPQSNCYMIYSDATAGTPEMKLAIPAKQAQDGQNAIANIAGTGGALTSIDFTTAKVKVLWQTMADAKLKAALGTTPTKAIASDASNYYITLDFSEASKKVASGNNAVIALCDANDKILWSWHLWFTDYRPNPSNFNSNGQVDLYANSNGKASMDRNLGATVTGVTQGIGEQMSTNPTWADANATKLYGLYYQWGRKDPFTGPKANAIADNMVVYNGDGGPLDADGTTAGSVPFYKNEMVSLGVAAANPTVFYFKEAGGNDGTTWTPRNDNLWLPGSGTDGNNAPSNNPTNTGKSIFDPCPPGWRVPGATAWNVKTNPWAGFNGFKIDETNNSILDVGYNGDGVVNSENALKGKTPDNPTIFQYYSQGSNANAQGMQGNVSGHFTNGRLYKNAGVQAWFPAAGYRMANTGKFSTVGHYGYCWSSVPNGGRNLYFACSGVNPVSSYYRSNGFHVRCVQE